MNRTDIAYQVSLTMDGDTAGFDLDAILDDLADAGVQDSVDDIDSDTYWEIVNRHDTGAQAEEQAEKAHANYLKAEVAYKEATVARQVAFAQAIDAMGRGGNAVLSRKVGLAAPTVKSIADRGRELLAAMESGEFTAWLTTDASLTLNGEQCEVNVTEDKTGGIEPVRATVLAVSAGPDCDDTAAQDAAEAVLQAAGWTVVGDWEQTDHGYSAKVSLTD